MESNNRQTCVINSPVGNISIEGDRQGVSKISFTEDQKTSAEIPKVLQECVNRLKEYFAGKRKTFSIPLNLKGTDFQKKVWHLLLEIPFSKRVSYAEQSRRYGDSKAIRAIANANGKNPIAIVIPCHRVIGSDGSLTGYAGGIWRKKWLLNHESENKQQRLFESI